MIDLTGRIFRSANTVILNEGIHAGNIFRSIPITHKCVGDVIKIDEMSTICGDVPISRPIFR